MKKYIALLLCLIMILSLFSCKSDQNQNDLSSNENSDSTDINDDTTNDNIAPQPSEAEIAMEMYEAVIKGETCVFDEQLGEISLSDCRFLTNNVTVGECEFINKAILDMDGDGINEYVIQSPQRDHIILRYYDGNIYSYSFDSKSLYRLNTDGTFYWYSTDSDSTNDAKTIGLNRITFDSSFAVIKEIYRLKDVFKYAEYASEYYLEDRQVTREEYLGYYTNNRKTWAQFTPFDVSCQYPINTEMAWKIADDYLGNIDERREGAAGTTIVYKVVITEKPSEDDEYYCAELQEFHYHHWFDGWQVSSSEPIYILENLRINAITGECREYVDPIPDGKG